jgi:SAM-dependent methyltransferase
MRIRHHGWRDCWRDYDGLLDWLTALPDVTRVCEVGAGANPVLTTSEIGRRGLQHTILDVSPTELAKALGGYQSVCADISSATFSGDGSWDLVTSSFLAEHIADARMFHRNVLSMLRPGGYALHLFPTLTALPFLMNRIAPEAVSERALRRVQGFREANGPTGKFPARYEWCRGPTRRQLRRIARTGFEVVDYGAYYGHGYYLRRPRLHAVEQVKAG